MHTEGRHLILDVWFSRYSDSVLKESLDSLVFQSFHVVNTVEYFFEPQGFTRIYVLKESHVAVHTYPEHGYISVDVYICNPDFDLAAIAARIRGLFPLINYDQRILTRGHSPRFGLKEGLPLVREMSPFEPEDYKA
jgi:S-adenosylmethionine/arginine decarboxylase-like enzyme